MSNKCWLNSDAWLALGLRTEYPDEMLSSHISSDNVTIMDKSKRNGGKNALIYAG